MSGRVVHVSELRPVPPAGRRPRAAVGVQRRAGDVLGQVGREEQRRAADVLVGALTAHRDARGDDRAGRCSIGMPSVGVWSGAMVLTRIRSGASSSASVREKLVTAPFMPAYTAYPGAARWPSIDVMLMMLPPWPCCRIWLAARCVRVQQPAEVRPDDRVPPADVGVDEVGLERAPGDVHQRVDLAEAREAVGERLADRVGVANVDRARRSGSSPVAAVTSATVFAKQLLVLVEEHEVHARLGEVDRRRRGRVHLRPPAINATLPCSPARSSRCPMPGSSPMTGGRAPVEPRSGRGAEAQEGDAVVAVVEHRRDRPCRCAIARGLDVDERGRHPHALGELDHGEQLRHLVGERRRGRLLGHRERVDGAAPVDRRST